MSDTYPRSEGEWNPPAPERRNPLGWIVLGLLFATMIFREAKRPSSEGPQDRIERYTNRLNTALAAYEAGDNPIIQLVSGETADAPLRKFEGELESKRRTEAIEAGFWTVVRKHLGERVTEEDLAPLKRDKDYALLVEANRPDRRTKAEAQSLVAKLERRGAASKLAADHVRREAGMEAKEVPKERAKTGGLFILGFLLLSGLAWIKVFALGISGTFVLRGPASEARTGAEADRMALTVATLMAAFLGLSLIAGQLIKVGLDPLAAQALASGGMLFVVPFALRAHPSMAEVGLHTRDFARNVGLGLWAFLLEVPVTLVVSLVSTVLLRNLPQPEHPASTALMSSPSFWTVVVTVFGGVIVAPFWEETVFRGLLFPALRRVFTTGRSWFPPVAAALVSSFLFASIHPQGPVLWAALATVALFSCVLAQTTRSLVPSITMHFAHNATIFVLTILMSH